jgi:tRNA threonylcarbamoyladenosine biosynthesis protein TsaE
LSDRAQAARLDASPPVSCRRRYDLVTHSPEETIAFGRQLSGTLSPPCVVLLEGELGSGKTVLTKGVVAGLGAADEGEVASPTFALVHEYAGRRKVYHVDLYRVESDRELASLGLEELLAENAIVIVEWGEKLLRAPLPRFEIRLEHRGQHERRITVEDICAKSQPRAPSGGSGNIDLSEGDRGERS